MLYNYSCMLVENLPNSFRIKIIINVHVLFMFYLLLHTCTCTCSYCCLFFQDPFCRVCAVVKDFLTRRLLKPEKIEDIVITIKVCASFQHGTCSLPAPFTCTCICSIQPFFMLLYVIILNICLLY